MKKCRFALGLGRVYDVVDSPHRWLVKPAPTAFLSHRDSVGKYLINIVLNTLDYAVGAGFTNNS